MPKLVFCANVLRYDCGCIAEWEYVGIFAHIPEYHIIPCYKHAKVIDGIDGREIIEELANIDWERITSEVTK